MTTTTPCPDAGRLSALLHGSLSEAEQSELTTHLESCTVCQETLQNLAAGSGSWAGIAEQLGSDDTPAESALHELMNRLAGATLQAETQTGGGTNHAGDTSLEFLMPAEKPNQIGKLGHYEVLEVIGRGAFGVVLKAFDPKLHRVVAIKVLSPALASSATARKRFDREAKSAAAVSHDHIVAIYAVEDKADPPYLVMYYVAGQSLQQRLDRDGILEVREILRIGLQTARGLAAAHAQGHVHRDIKPANILLENGVERVKLTDFGLARAADDASLTQSGVIAGTPQFMAPEQARGELVDHRADLFSLGSVLYTMCTGRPPFRATTTMGVLKRVCDDDPRPIREINPEIPEWLCSIIAKLHAKEPADRFHSAKELADLLGQHLAHLQQPDAVAMPAPVVVPASGVASPRVLPGDIRGTNTTPARRRSWVVAAVVAACVLLLVTCLGIPVALLAFWGLVHTDLVVHRGGEIAEPATSTKGSATGYLGKLQGTWRATSCTVDGAELPDTGKLRLIVISFDGEHARVSFPVGVFGPNPLLVEGVCHLSYPSFVIKDASGKTLLKGAYIEIINDRTEELEGFVLDLNRKLDDGPSAFRGEVTTHFHRADDVAAAQTDASLAGVWASPFGEVKLEHDPIGDKKQVLVTGSWKGEESDGTIKSGHYDLSRGELVIRTSEGDIGTLHVVQGGRALVGFLKNDEGGGKPWVLWRKDSAPMNPRSRVLAGAWNSPQAKGEGAVLVPGPLGGEEPVTVNGTFKYNGGKTTSPLMNGKYDPVTGHLTYTANWDGTDYSFEYLLSPDGKSLDGFYWHSGGEWGIWPLTRQDAASPAPQTDEQRLQGAWRAVAGERGGRKATPEELAQISLAFTGNHVKVTMPSSKSDEGTLTLNPTTDPKQMTVRALNENRQAFEGIYRFEGDRLVICMGDAKTERPKSFTSRPDTSEKPNDSLFVVTLERVAKDVVQMLDEAKLQGTWMLTSIGQGGVNLWAPELPGFRHLKVTFAGDRFQPSIMPNVSREKDIVGVQFNLALGTTGVFHLDPTTNPRRITVFAPNNEANSIMGIYRLEGDTLTLCYCAAPKEIRYPTEFTTKPKDGKIVLAFKRQVPPDPASDEAKLQGTWKSTSLTSKKHPDLNFDDDRFELQWPTTLDPDQPTQDTGGVFQLDTGANPKRLRVAGPSYRKTPLLGIYRLEGDTLTFCYRMDPNDDKYPSTFATNPAEGAELLVLKRIVARKPQAAGFVPLFNGKDLTGWKPAVKNLPTAWSVPDGLLRGTGPSYLATERAYGDFHLWAELRINDGADAGIHFRSEPLEAVGMKRWPDSYAIQMNAGRPVRLRTTHANGSSEAYARAGLIAPDTWVTLEIIAQDNRVLVLVDGKKELDYVDADRKHTKGRIALQAGSDSSVIEFRKIEIHELPTPPAPASKGVEAVAAQPRDELQGFWTPVAATKHGQRIPDSEMRKHICGGLLIDGERWGSVLDGKLQEGGLKLGSAGSFKTIEFIGSIFDKRSQGRGIYKVEGDVLTLCLAERGKALPTSFATDASNDNVTIIYRREPPGTVAVRLPAEAEKLQGVWKSMSVGPMNLDVTFEGDRFGLKWIPKPGQQLPSGMKPTTTGFFRLDPQTRRITVTDEEGKSKQLLGIYRLEGDTLSFCYRTDPKDEKFPSQFAAGQEGSHFVMLKRTEAAPNAPMVSNLRQIANLRESELLKTLQQQFIGKIGKAELVDAESTCLAARIDLAEAEQKHAEAISHAQALVAKLEEGLKVQQELVNIGRLPPTALDKTGVALAQAKLRLSKLDKPAETPPVPDQPKKPQQTWRQALQENLWPNGSTLTVAFIDDVRIPEIEASIREACLEWSKYANLNFTFVGQDQTADVRITFNHNLVPLEMRTWPVAAVIGTQGLNRVAHPEWTMWVNAYKPKIAANVLHEIGHILGLRHEQDRVRPDLDEEAVYAYGRQGGKLTREQVYHAMIKPLYSLEGSDLDRFDPDSIMVLPSDKAPVLKGGGVLRDNKQLSEQDKRLISELYPGRWKPSTPKNQ